MEKEISSFKQEKDKLKQELNDKDAELEQETKNQFYFQGKK